MPFTGACHAASSAKAGKMKGAESGANGDSCRYKSPLAAFAIIKEMKPEPTVESVCEGCYRQIKDKVIGNHGNVAATKA